MLDCYLLEARHFLMKNGKVVDKEEKGSGDKLGEKGGWAIIMMYYMRKKLLSIKGKSKNN